MPIKNNPFDNNRKGCFFVIKDKQQLRNSAAAKLKFQSGLGGGLVGFRKASDGVFKGEALKRYHHDKSRPVVVFKKVINFSRMIFVPP